MSQDFLPLPTATHMIFSLPNLLQQTRLVYHARCHVHTCVGVPFCVELLSMVIFSCQFDSSSLDNLLLGTRYQPLIINLWFFLRRYAVRPSQELMAELLRYVYCGTNLRGLWILMPLVKLMVHGFLFTRWDVLLWRSRRNLQGRYNMIQPVAWAVRFLGCLNSAGKWDPDSEDVGYLHLGIWWNLKYF